MGTSASQFHPICIPPEYRKLIVAAVRAGLPHIDIPDDARAGLLEWIDRTDRGYSEEEAVSHRLAMLLRHHEYVILLRAGGQLVCDAGGVSGLPVRWDRQTQGAWTVRHAIYNRWARREW